MRQPENISIWAGFCNENKWAGAKRIISLRREHVYFKSLEGLKRLLAQPLIRANIAIKNILVMTEKDTTSSYVKRRESNGWGEKESEIHGFGRGREKMKRRISVVNNERHGADPIAGRLRGNHKLEKVMPIFRFD